MEKTKIRKTISVADKVKIIAKFDEHVGTRVDLAKELSIPVSTLNTIVKSRETITINAAKCGPSAKKRKYVKDSRFKQLEEILLEWFVGARAANLPINGTLMREKARVIASRLDIQDFTASNGWIDRFKKRHNVVYKAICGESKSVDLETVEHWKETQLPEKIAGFDPKNVFNADETGLFFNVLPDKTFSYKGEKCHGGKLSKQRITVLLLANADGSEKFPLLVIGKAKKPRCFKNIKKLPTKYEANTKAWMTSTFFQNQLLAFDAKMGLQNRKVVLFIDQCPAHKITSQLHNVEIVFFPANCTSELQPLDLGIIQAFKFLYRKYLVARSVLMLDTGKEPSSMKIDLLNALHFAARAWNEVKISTIQNCFVKAGFVFPEVACTHSVDDYSNIEDVQGHEKLLQKESFQDYVEVDSHVVTSEMQCVEDLVHEHCSKSQDNDEEEDDDDEDQEMKTPPTTKDALAALQTLRDYISVTADENCESVFDNVYALEKQIMCLNRERSKQTKISAYFTNK